MRHIVRNLLENAYEALPDGRGVVTLTARPLELTQADCLDYFGRPQPGPNVELRITDTGCGLTPEVQRQLFVEPFFTTKSRRRGLGLAVAYGIAFANKGGLRLSNGPAGGVIAEVVFPAAPASAATASARAEFPAVRAEPAPPTDPLRPKEEVRESEQPDAGEKVLVVDDDPLVLRFVRMTLQQAGYRVQAVATAEEALASFHASPMDSFSLVLSDLVLPRISGVDLAQGLLRSDANVRLLFMTGQAGCDAASKDAAAYPIELIQKPFRSERLLRAVRTAIDRPPIGRPQRRLEGGAGADCSTAVLDGETI